MNINVETLIHSTIEKVWEYWTEPKHIVNWNFASNDWCCPSAINEVSQGGKFIWRMEAKDGSFGFDFSGIYEEIEIHKLISYKIGDGRGVNIEFISEGNSIKITENFEAESSHSDEQQKAGWQAILDNFKKYVEAHN